MARRAPPCTLLPFRVRVVLRGSSLTRRLRVATLHGLAPRLSSSCPLHKVHFRLTGAVTHKHRVHAPGPERHKHRQLAAGTGEVQSWTRASENEALPPVPMWHNQALAKTRRFQCSCCATSKQISQFCGHSRTNVVLNQAHQLPKRATSSTATRQNQAQASKQGTSSMNENRNQAQSDGIF